MINHLQEGFDTFELVEALRALDETRIKRYAISRGVMLPPTKIAFWAGVHKARVSHPEMDGDEKAVSRAWLAEHGFRPGPL